MTTASPRRQVPGDTVDQLRGTGNPTTTASIRTTILVVSRDQLFADVVGVVMDQRGAYKIVSARSGHDAVQRATDLRPAVALISLDPEDVVAEDGVSLIAGIRAGAPGTLLLGMARAPDRWAAARAAELGLPGVVSADESVTCFIRRIDEALRQRGTESLPIEERGSTRSQSGGIVVGELTTRESEVLGLLVQSQGGRAIADRLHISRNTVRGHLQSIFHKLHVHSRLEAAAFAVKHDMFEPGADPTVDRVPTARWERSA